MKTLAIFVALALSAFISNAQQFIELKEAKVEFNPLAQNITKEGNSFSVNIKENYTGEFTRDPIAFMHTHFNIQEIIAELGDENYDRYQVSFKSRKGVLNADFNADGTLIGTDLKFTDIVVPSPLQHQLYRDYKGWEMVENMHVAKESNGKVVKDFYRITMKKGKEKLKLKINTSDINRAEVALN